MSHEQKYKIHNHNLKIRNLSISQFIIFLAIFFFYAITSERLIHLAIKLKTFEYLSIFGLMLKLFHLSLYWIALKLLIVIFSSISSLIRHQFISSRTIL
jgi:hypothetical protein